MSLTITPGTGEYTTSPGTSYTTANSVSPSAGSMVVVLLDIGCSSTETLTVKDSLGNVYVTNGVWAENTSIKTYNMIYTYVYSSAPGSITFTVTFSPAASSMLIRPVVIGGQSSDQSGANTEIAFSSSSTSTCEITVTPTVIGSYFFVVGGANGVTSATPNSNTANYTNHASSGTITHLTGRTGASVNLTPEVIGWTLSPASSQGYAIAALEVVPFAVSNGTLTTTATSQTAFGGKKTGFTGLTAAATANTAVAGTKTAEGTLTTAATAHAAVAGIKTRFGTLTTAATAHAAVAGTKTALGALAPAVTTIMAAAITRGQFGRLVASATAHLAIAGKKTGLGVLTPAASTVLTVAGNKTGFSALTTAASTVLTVAANKTRFSALTAGVTAQGVITSPVQGALTAGATAQAEITPAGTVTGAVQAAVSAALTAAGTKTANGALTAAATAQAVFSGLGSGAVTAAVTAVLQAAGLGSGAVTSSVMATLRFTGTKTAIAALTAEATVHASLAGTRERFSGLTAAVTTGLQVAGTKTASGALTTTATVQAAFTGTRGQFSGLIQAVTAALQGAGIRAVNGALITAAAAQDSFAGIDSKFAAITTAAAARMYSAGSRSFSAVTSGITALLSAAGENSTDSGALTAFITTVFKWASVRPPHNLGGAVSVLSDIGVPENDVGGTVSQVAYGGGSAVTTAVNGTAVESNALLGAAIYEADLGGTMTMADLGGGAVGWTMQNVNLNFAEFNDITLSVTITSNGVALDLTDYTVNMLLKPVAGIVDGDPSVLLLSSGGESPAITVTDASAGECTVAIAKSNLQDSSLAFYRVDAVDGSGNINTAIYGGVSYTAL